MYICVCVCISLYIDISTVTTDKNHGNLSERYDKVSNKCFTQNLGLAEPVTGRSMKTTRGGLGARQQVIIWNNNYV